MSGEIVLAVEAVLIATAAIGMYGKVVLAKAWDDVAGRDAYVVGRDMPVTRRPE